MSGDGQDPHNRSTPPSFIPSGSHRRHQSGTPVPGHDQSVPPSFTPPGSTHDGERGRLRAPRSAQSSNPGASSASAPRPNRSLSTSGGVLADRSQQISRRRHHPLRIISTILLLLLVALLLALAGTWNWVDTHLDKTSWLTGSANTPGTSWLILGSDERDESGGVGGSASDTPGSRTDTILVLTRAANGKGSLISIPRDSLVKVNDEHMKINGVVQLEGRQTLIGEVEQITGEHIDHVAQIQFDGLQNVVDALGGVELCYDADVNDANSGLVWTKGCHNADGGTALAFSRMRYSDPQGDFGRAQRQRQVVAAIIKKTSSAQVLTNISTLHKVAETSLDSVIVDEDANPYTLLMMALTMRAASGGDGVTGSVYWANPDYYVQGVGSTVLLDADKNTALFEELMQGTHAAGTVGTLAETE